MEAEVTTQTEVIGRFFVAGRPVTKGSIKPLPRRKGNGQLAITLHDKPEAYKWLQTLIKGIRDQVGIVPVVSGKKVVGVEPPWPHAGPVRVDFTAYFAREYAVANGRQLMNVIPSHNTPYPTAETCGDGDKLERCLWDALTQSGMITDDRMVVEWSGRKRWADGQIGRHGVRAVPGIACEVWPA